MRGRSLVRLVIGSATLGLLLTAFYFVHEGLPRAIRAPTSLLLAPIAIVDGICYALGVRGIYGRLVPVTLVNWAFAAAMWCGAVRGLNWWRRRTP